MLKLLTTFLLIFIAAVALAQSAGTFSISGKAISADSGAPIAGGSVMIDKHIGTTCDTAGQFSIRKLRQGKYKLSFRSLGYHKKDTVITIEGKNIKGIILTVPVDYKTLKRQKALKGLKKDKAILFAN